MFTRYRSSVSLLGFALALMTVVLPGASTAQEADGWGVDIPFQRFVLDNGLTLIVHEDHKAPIVAVNVWYHVGSKNEKVGKTGFAHLFEHLMFNGSENDNDDYFKALGSIGATGLNGTTNFDRTNYFENVPKTAMDVALWMESDRMGHLLGAIDQDKLDEQRGVVQNEKRQGENQPYGQVFNLVFENLFPAGHPYSWSVIGSMDDLNAASVEDVHGWFEGYYGTANAVLVVAGDVEAQDVLARVERAFGDIPSGPPVIRHETWIPKRTGEQRQMMHDRVPLGQITKVWAVPEWGTEEGAYLTLASQLLSSGKNSRLFKRLVYDDQIAQNANTFAFLLEIAGTFFVQATAKPGVDLGTVEAALDEELARFIAAGPTEEELTRAKTQLQSSFIRGVERIGGFGGKSDALAQNEVYGGSPDYYKTFQSWMRDATAEQIRATAEKWLTDGSYVLEVLPFPQFAEAPTGIDRSTGVPQADDPPDAVFPEMHRATLSNGLQVILVERDAVPVVNLRLLMDAGYASDHGALAGTAQLAMSMLDEGTESRSALEIADELSMLGATLGAGSDLDLSTVTMSALKTNLEASLDLFADVILSPSFPEEDFQRLKRQQMAGIQQEKSQPITMALRVFPKFLYGEDHAYGNPLTGSGTEESVGAISRDDLVAFHETWFHPNNATLVVVGATALDELVPLLEERFQGWGRGSAPEKNIGEVAHSPSSTVYLMDRPGSIQSIIFAGHVAPPKDNPREIAIGGMNDVLGGGFNARINMNLREDKGWSYGAQSLVWDARGQRLFFVFAPVQTDRTAESVQEILSELRGIGGDRPATPEELTRIKNEEVLALPGRWETANAVAGSIAEIVQFGYPEDYWDSYASRVEALTLNDIGQAADILRTDNLIWVVVGDREQVEEKLRALGIGPIILIDADGNIISAADRTD